MITKLGLLLLWLSIWLLAFIEPVGGGGTVPGTVPPIYKQHIPLLINGVFHAEDPDEYSGVNQVESYDVLIEPASGPRWKIIELRKLTGDENRGRHNVYVNVLDATGERDRNPELRIGWDWEGRGHNEQAPPQRLNKPDGETGHGNVVMEKGMITTVWIEGDSYASDKASGMHIMHPDEEDGNTWGHHSFLVVFQKTP